MAADWNRSALKHCVMMMGWLLPAVLQVWIDHGADEDWGQLLKTVKNQEEFAKLLKSQCLPKPGVQQAAAQVAAQSAAASITFRAAARRHPGIESAIGGLQSGNGQKRCRDRGELGLERYLALGIQGRNLHTFGRLLEP